MRKLLVITAMAGLGMALSPTQGLALVNLTTQTATATSTTGSSGDWSATATCPSGYSVTGGGWSVPAISGDPPVQVWNSEPSGNGWYANGHLSMSNPSGYTYTVYAICGAVI